MHCIVFLLELQKINGSNEKVYNLHYLRKFCDTQKSRYILSHKLWRPSN